MIAGIFTYESIVSIIPIVAVVIWTIVSWQENPKWMRVGEAAICVMWIIYDLIVGAYTGMITEFIILGSSVVGIIRNDLNKSLQKEEK
ncbi:MAG: YgjV family protein [Clostridia bacterium]|nr:YgjV family protein [Clostridia bacterium]